MNRRIFFLLLFLSSITFCLSGPTNHPFLKSSTKSSFIENKGQIIDQNNKPNPGVLYLLNSPGFNVQLRKSGFSYDLYTATGLKRQAASKNLKPDACSLNPDTCSLNPEVCSLKYHRIDFDLLNANPNPVIETSEPSSDYLNYYTTGTPEEGVTFVHYYQSVIYHDIYPHIDLEFRKDENTGFKYNLIVKPGGDLENIKLKITGPLKIEARNNGLFLSTTLGDILEEIPASIAFNGKIRTNIHCRFIRLNGDIYGFSSEQKIENNSTLFIDPYPERLWGTYYGGSLEDEAWGGCCASDANGSAIIAGQTKSLNNIATSGSHQSSYGGGQFDAFLVRFLPDGQRQWGTYYGGSLMDVGYSCAYDHNGNIFLGGQTASTTNIATAGAFQTTLNGWADAFLVKFTPDGVRIWGTYYGGNVGESFSSIVFDAANNIYCAGSTASSVNISTPGAWQETYGGPFDGILIKFTQDGQRIWGTYYGGSGMENDCICTIDSANHIYLTGHTQSANNIASPGSFMPDYNGIMKGFLACFDTAGVRKWGTYWGGSNEARIYFCAAGPLNTVFITGYTKSVDSISTPGAWQPALNGNTNAFIAKFDTNGNRLWGTYYGAGSESAYGCAVDDSGFVYICGIDSNQNSVIPSPDTYQSIYGGGVSDGFLAKFSGEGQRVWSTYYGGEGDECPSACAVDGHDHTFFYGYTNSETNIASPGAHQTNLGGNLDCFLVKFNDCFKPDHTEPINGPFNVCKNTTGINYTTSLVTYATGYHWSCPIGIKITGGQNTQTLSVKIDNSAVSGNISVYAYDPCGNADTAYLAITVHDDPVITITGNDTVCQGTPSNFGTSPGNTIYQWSVSPAGNIVAGGTSTSNTITIVWNTTGANWVTVNYVDANGCTDTLPVQHTVWVNTGNPVSVSITASTNNVCEGTPVTFTAIPMNGGSSPAYQWKVNGFNTGTNSSNYTYNPTSGDLVSCILTSSNTTCVSNNPATSNTIIMVINPNIPVSVSISASSNPACSGIPVTFTANPVNGGSSPSYQWKVNGINVGINSSTYTFTPVAGDLISCNLTSSDTTCISNNPATSNTVIMVINDNLVIDLTIAASLNPVCLGTPVTFTATPVNGGSSPIYQWKVNGVNVWTNSSTYTYNPVSGDQILCILTSNIVCPIGNPATSNTIIMNVPASPVVTFTRCNDSITTTNAQPFKLKGGVPLGGTYSGAGVTGGVFHPAVAGAGTHQITYTYTNAALCSTSAIVPIVTIVPTVTTCGQILTDIRDGKIYPTVQIGSQCWLAEDLNYGTEISSNMDQRDNCIPEKYHNPASSIQYPASVYQWDEIMNYDETISTQGLCPPGWHVPMESDWNTLFANYISNAFASNPLKYSGFSGFNALLYGARHLNKTWDYKGFATFFWSSTAHEVNKAWAHGMNDVDPSVSLYPALRSNAFSVRCLKD